MTAKFHPRRVKKYYFSRVDKTTVYANDEEEARAQLADIYAESEEFVLDNVIDMIEVSPGEYRAVGQ